MMLGEANLPRKDQVEYFGGADGDGLTMQFDFITMQNLYLSLARDDPAPLIAALESRPEIAVESQWANFVRNHDELTLDKLTDAERQEVFAAFGPEPRDAGLRPRHHPPPAARCSTATRAASAWSTA